MDIKINYIQSSTTSSFSASTSLPTEIIQAHGQWIQDDIGRGWDGYWMSFMFRQLPGSRDAIVQQMHREIVKVYGKLASRIVRKPRSKNWAHLLPRGVFFPDVPAYKRQKQRIQDVAINDGLHMHGIVLVSKKGRLKKPLDTHFHDHQRLYGGGNISRIYIEPIISDAAFVTDYGGKAIKKKRFSYDDILVFPKTVDDAFRKKKRIGCCSTSHQGSASTV